MTSPTPVGMASQFTIADHILDKDPYEVRVINAVLP